MNLSIWSLEQSIGHTSLMVWWIIYSYYLCSCICLLKAISCKVCAKPLFRFWIVVAAVLILLGMNRQFNLLSAVTDVGRIIFTRLDWMGYHRIFQSAIMIMLFLGGSLLLVRVYPRRIKGLPRARRFITIGAIYLVFFVLERSISLHQFDAVLSLTITGVYINRLAELAGIYWVLFWLIADTILHDKRQNDSGNLFNSETP